MPRELTARQLRFATLLASGKKSIVAAFRETYEPRDPRAKHVYRNSFRLSRHPGVRAKIAELQMQMSPSLDDAAAVQRHAVAVAFHLSVGARSERVRLRAAQLLFDLSEKLQAVRDANPAESARLLAGLRNVYRRVMKLDGAEMMPPAESSVSVPGEGRETG
jgi:hypothetical protein